MFKSRASSSMLDGGLNVAVSPFELIAIKRNLPQVTSSNWNSLLSRNSIITPSTLTMGSQRFSLWLALVGPCKERWPYGVLKGCACHASMFKMPILVLKRSACRASTFKMAVLCSQALHLPHFNLYDAAWSSQALRLPRFNL